MKNSTLLASCVFVPAVLFVSGCATTGQSARGVEHFDPVPPMAAVGSEDLAPVESGSRRSVTDLLRDADRAFQAANTAQEAGDEEAALRHYVTMLEMLTEADLDPKIFYSLRQEFGAILNSSSQHAALFQPRTASPLDDGAVQPAAAAPGNLSAFEIPFPLPERVLDEIDKIQNGYPKNFQIFLDRSHKYLPYIRQRLREEGVPEEMAYLALVESGFQPKIVSRAGAGGMWQFMRPAAQRFNLRVDSHVDERYDWISATDAAISYLKILYSHFNGSWPLALSAYNMGEGGLERAIEANGGDTDLWRLLETPPASNRIRQETKDYFARFVATVIVAHSPERYGFRVNPVSPEELVKVPVSGSFSLSALDRQMGYAEGTLARLNPALLNETTPPIGNYHVLVPAPDTVQFASVLSSTETLKLAGGSHKVKRGETVTQIATRHGVSATELMRINGIRTARGLRAGETLKLPGDGSEGMGGADEAPEEMIVAKRAPEARAEERPSSRNAASVGGTVKASYVVRPGDTLFDIAKAHKVSIADLQTWNNKGRRSRLKVGETLHVGDTVVSAEPEPQAEERIVTASAAGGDFHEVKPGEYPAKIAHDYDVPLRDFLAWNNLGSKSTIKVGDKLVVAAGTPEQARENTEEIKVASAAPAPKVASAKASEKSKEVVGTTSGVPGAKATHTVKKGESASVIAQKYGVKTSDFLAWNGLTSKSVLQAGKTYNVFAPSGSTPPSKRGASAAASETIHKVATGQNPTTIARRYGVKLSDLFKWNNWPKNHVLQVGDKVVIRKG